MKRNESGDMSLVEHLEELRTRIIISLAAWGVAAGSVYYFAPRLLALMEAPLHRLHISLYVTTLQGAFMVELKMALMGGLFVAGPVILWQVLLFVMPALTKGERRALIATIPFGILLFMGGAVFAYMLILPTAVRFLMSFTSEELKPIVDVQNYIGFVTTLLLMTGLVFQMPLVMLFLSFIGLVNASLLSTYRRVAWFGCFLLSAVMTPTPDAFTMIAVALPMVLLYEISILLVRFVKRPPAVEEPEEEPAESAF
ncbi:MAG: twin-arginine translocase subunit TatC [Candidatus Xenobia bacterium]